MRRNTAAAVAGLWGFAEATLFVVVPDVALTLLAARSPRTGIAAAVASALGAALGGAAMWSLARHDPALAHRLLVALPGITEAMVARADARFVADGVGAMLAAGWTGVPYKIFAVAAGTDGLPLGPFLLATVAVRLPRFVVAAVAGALAGRLFRRPRTVLAVAWLLFYAAYFSLAG